MLEHLATNESQTFLAGISSQFNAILVLDDFGMEFGVRGKIWVAATPSLAAGRRSSNAGCVLSMQAEYAPFNHDYVPRVVFADPDGTVSDCSSLWWHLVAHLGRLTSPQQVAC